MHLFRIVRWVFLSWFADVHPLFQQFRSLAVFEVIGREGIEVPVNTGDRKDADSGINDVEEDGADTTP